MHGCSSITVFLLYGLLVSVCFAPLEGVELGSFVSNIEDFINNRIGHRVLEDALTDSSRQLNRDSESILNKVEKELSNEINVYFGVVTSLKTALETGITDGDPLTTKDCCNRDQSQHVTPTQACLQRSEKTSQKEQFMDSFLTMVGLLKISKAADLLLRYVDSNGIMIQYPAISTSSFCDTRNYAKIPWYSSTKLSRRKRIVILYDEELIASEPDQSLRAIQSALQTISATDQFNVVLFSSHAHTTISKNGYIDCRNTQLVSGTHQNKNRILSWLKNTKWERTNQSNYTAAFREAFTSLNYSTSRDTDVNIILFVSSIGQDDDPELLFDMFNRYKDLSTVIHTYGMQDSLDDILAAIARQNGTAVSAGRNNEAVAGRYVKIGDFAELSDQIGIYYKEMAAGNDNFTYWGWPDYNYDVKDSNLSITISVKVERNGAFRGVVGADFNAERLFSDILSGLRARDDVVAFVVDQEYYVVAHTSLAITSLHGVEMPRIHILELHPSKKLAETISYTLENGVSQAVVELMRRSQLDSTATTMKSFTLSCKQTRFAVYVICVGLEETSENYAMTVSKPEYFKFNYHRLDLMDIAEPCYHASKTAIIESTVQLTVDAFLNHSRDLLTEETRQTLLRYDSDLADETSNVFTSQARSDIYFTYTLESRREAIDEYLPTTHLGKITLWRYVASANGVLRIWPGTQLPQNYDPRRSEWYRLAANHKDGKFIISTPYKDVITKHWIVTFAKAIRYPSDSATREYAVIGFDIFLRKLEEYLFSMGSTCTDFCGLSNPEGYMVYHPTMLTDNHDLKSHITEFEPEMSEHLTSIGLLQKSKCRTYTPNGSVDHEFFTFNINELSQSVNVHDNIGYMSDINILVISKASYPDTGKCQSYEDRECRAVSCQTPCHRDVKSSCRPYNNSMENLTLPFCRLPTLTYANTPNPLGELEKCYEHFEQPEQDTQNWSWIITVGQVVSGLAVFGICTGVRFMQSKRLEQTRNNNAVTVTPTDGNPTSANGSTDPQITNFGSSFPNGPGFQPGTPMNQQFNQWGAAQMTQAPVFSQQQGFATAPPSVPAPSYEESFRYGNSR